MIYCVEDEKSIRELMIYTLQLSGFEVLGCENYHELYTALKLKKPELILLDIMLPEKDGLEILSDLKRNEDTAAIPVIMATAKTTELDKVTGLDQGADDYLAKPFGMMEMVSRIKAVLRRTNGSGTDSPVLHYRSIEIDTGKHIVRVNQDIINLTLKEYELLVHFVKHPAMVFTREQLLEQIWGLNFLGESRTVDVHIGTLRNKLKEAGKYISTIRKVGYCLESETNG